MAVIRKDCDYCGQPIELRELGPNRWKPFDPNGRRHQCAGRSASSKQNAPASAPSHVSHETSARPAPTPAPAVAAMTTEQRPAPAASGNLGKFLLPAALLVLGAIFFLPRLLNRNDPNDAANIPAVPSMSVPPTIAASGSGSANATRTPKPRPTATSSSRTTAGQPAPASDAPAACNAFSNQVWAQAIYDQNPGRNAALDPDGDGFACEELPYGAVPALWTSTIPNQAEEVQLVSTIDGDTIVVRRQDGRTENVRLVGIDTPETGKGTRPLECYGEEATEFTRILLTGAEGKTVWLEKDQEDRDRYDRLLRYVWFMQDGQIYMANDAIVRAGYAERYRDTPNRRYYQNFIDGQNFAKAHEYGIWSACQ
jgi:micrococcal nuclease